MQAEPPSRQILAPNTRDSVRRRKALPGYRRFRFILANDLAIANLGVSVLSISPRDLHRFAVSRAEFGLEVRVDKYRKIGLRIAHAASGRHGSRSGCYFGLLSLGR
jgi:hypothetical protein